MLFISISTIIFLSLCILLPETSSMMWLGNFLAILTHSFIFPCVWLTRKTPWLSYTLLSTAIFSILFHLTDEEIILQTQTPLFMHADMAAQTLLIWIATFLFLFDQLPTFAIPVLFVVTICTASFNTQTVLGIAVYVWLDSIPVVCMVAFVLYNLVSPNNVFFKSIRKWQDIVYAISFFAVGLFLYNVGDYYKRSNKYFYIFTHSGWHVAAYTSIFYTFKSRTEEKDDYIRIERKDFS